jgi:DNA-binding response OmpR family regulator
MEAHEHMRLLIVDDELDFVNALAKGLRRERYAIDTAADGDYALELLSENEYDLVILDLNLPGMDGIAVARLARMNYPALLILMLTARHGVSDRVIGLDCGADDYLEKPFAFVELLARLRALLRRDLRAREPAVRRSDITVDPRCGTVRRGEVPISLTHKEFAILQYLMHHSGEIVSAEELLEHVWDREVNMFTNTLPVHISALRRKLGDRAHSPRYIATVTGAGYRFLGDEPHTSC